jgi:peroxiredoxin
MQIPTDDPEGATRSSGWTPPDRGTRLRRQLIIAIDGLLLLIVLVLLDQRALPQASAALGFGASNAPAPLFTLATLDGDSISLRDLRGQVVLVNFWASWCPPCRVEMPGFERIYRDRAPDGFTIVGIVTDVHARDRIRAFLTEHDITYPTLLATPGVIREYGGINALCAITQLRPGHIREVPELDQFQTYIIEEVLALVRAKGITLPDPNPLESIKAYCAKKFHRVSMLQHLARGQQTEIDALNGYVARESEKLGLAAPYNDALTRLMKGVQYRPEVGEGD